MLKTKTTVNCLSITNESYWDDLLALILWKGTKSVPNARIFKEREKVKELRQSLDPEVELLCMLSPLQVIYALERKGKNMP